MKPIIITVHPFSAVAGAATLAGAGLLMSMQASTTATSISALTAEQEWILDKMSRVQLPTKNGWPNAETIRFSGVNVQIVNGRGETDPHLDGERPRQHLGGHILRPHRRRDQDHTTRRPVHVHRV